MAIEVDSRLSEVFQSCDALADRGEYDQAAKGLAEWRKAAAKKCREDWRHFGELLDIVLRQMRYLRRGKFPSECLELGKWLMCFRDHASSAVSSDVLRAADLVYREEYSIFLCTLAAAYADLGRHEDMRLTIVKASDTTKELRYVVAFALPLYSSICSKFDSIEGEPAFSWLAKRCAEFMAQLDFNGEGLTLHRQTVFELHNYLLESETRERREESYERLREFCDNDPDDSVIQSIFHAAQIVRRALQKEGSVFNDATEFKIG